MDEKSFPAERYSKKIYGFAWNKTQNHHDAQDLSQEILLALCGIDFASKKIADMDAYIHRVCMYTWSNFVRKNIRYWQNCSFFNEDMPSQEDVFQTASNRQLYEKLRREIMFLAQTKRKITVMYYYDGKSSTDIAAELSIPDSTVRWHLSNAKKIIKERIEMNDTIYIPKKLTVYFSGTANDFTLCGLRNDMLVQNICIVCANRPQSTEEIAGTLSVSPAYFEDKLKSLCDMGYLERTTNRYKTAFFIQDTRFITQQLLFKQKTLPAAANAVYDAVKNHLNEILDIGFYGSDADENFLMWAFTEIAAHIYFERNGTSLNSQPPLRADGSRHRIIATLDENDVFDELNKTSPDLAECFKNSSGAAGKHTGNERIVMQQFDPSSLIAYRGIFDSRQLTDLQRVYGIIKSGAQPDEYDKEVIARMCESGYVSVSDEGPVINIPYFTAEQHRVFDGIMRNIVLPEAEQQIGENLSKRYAEFIKHELPDSVSKDERDFLASHFYCPNAFTWFLLKEGKLHRPQDDRIKNICTVVWEK